jgi:hypothetical protein
VQALIRHLARAFTIFLLSLGACGASGGLAPDAAGGDPAAWLGNWTSTGTQSTTCGGATGTSQLSGLVVITDGRDPSTIKSVANNCALVWDLSGSSAELETGQLCTVSVVGSDVTVSWTQSSMTIDGNTITGTTTGATNNGCSFMQQATLTRS